MYFSHGAGILLVLLSMFSSGVFGYFLTVSIADIRVPGDQHLGKHRVRGSHHKKKVCRARSSIASLSESPSIPSSSLNHPSSTLSVHGQSVSGLLTPVSVASIASSSILSHGHASTLPQSGPLPSVSAHSSIVSVQLAHPSIPNIAMTLPLSPSLASSGPASSTLFFPSFVPSTTLSSLPFSIASSVFPSSLASLQPITAQPSMTPSSTQSYIIAPYPSVCSGSVAPSLPPILSDFNLIGTGCGQPNLPIISDDFLGDLYGPAACAARCESQGVQCAYFGLVDGYVCFTYPSDACVS